MDETRSTHGADDKLIKLNS